MNDELLMFFYLLLIIIGWGLNALFDLIIIDYKAKRTIVPNASTEAKNKIVDWFSSTDPLIQSQKKALFETNYNGFRPFIWRDVQYILNHKIEDVAISKMELNKDMIKELNENIKILTKMGAQEKNLASQVSRNADAQARAIAMSYLNEGQLLLAGVIKKASSQKTADMAIQYMAKQNIAKDPKLQQELGLVPAEPAEPVEGGVVVHEKQ
jgi:hypothetical protein